tara:strand:+ start:1110 stop:1325 length:216 start_codon:yes stop_codon:yes gene_type:complete
MMPEWELRAAMENAEAKVVEQAARIEQLEAALRDLLWYTNQLELTVYDPSDWPTEHDEVRNARAALGEERT